MPAQLLKKKNPYIGQGRNFKVKSGKYFLAFNFRFCCGRNREKRGFRFRVIYPQVFYCAYLQFRAKRKKYFHITLHYIFVPSHLLTKIIKRKPQKAWKKKQVHSFHFPNLIGYPGNFFSLPSERHKYYFPRVLCEVCVLWGNKGTLQAFS